MKVLVRWTMVMLMLIWANGVFASPTVFDQSSVTAATIGALNISDFVIAEDFTVSSTATLTGLRVWLADARLTSDNGVLDNFGGTLSWAIFANSAGSPGTLLASGFDATPVLTDTGFNGTGGTVAGDVVTADLDLGGPTLAPGTYWLGLHEGTWASAYDGSVIFWYPTLAGFGSTAHSNSDEVSLADPWQEAVVPNNTFETAFRLSGDVVQPVPEPTTMLLVGSGLIGLAGYGRKKFFKK